MNAGWLGCRLLVLPTVLCCVLVLLVLCMCMVDCDECGVLMRMKMGWGLLLPKAISWALSLLLLVWLHLACVCAVGGRYFAC